MQIGAELDQIAQTVQDYFLGMHHADVSQLRNAFHEKAQLFGYFLGKKLCLPLNAWLDMVSSRPAPSASGEPFDMHIVATDVSGEVATVKVVDLYNGLRFTDYLTLMKDEGRWVIVSKAFHHEPKA